MTLRFWDTALLRASDWLRAPASSKTSGISSRRDRSSSSFRGRRKLPWKQHRARAQDFSFRPFLAPLSSTAARNEKKTRLSSSSLFSMLVRYSCSGHGETGLHGQQQVPGAAVAST